MTRYKYKMVRFFLVMMTCLFLAWPSRAEIIESVSAPDGRYYAEAIKVSEDTIIVKFMGSFTGRAGGVLNYYLKKHEPALLSLSSSGGSVAVATSVALTILSRKIPVIVEKGAICVSACAYMALASPDITVHGQLAFHLPYYKRIPMDWTLDKISKLAAETATMQLIQFYTYQFRAYLYYKIIELDKKDPKLYLVFEDSDSINTFRFSYDSNDGPFIKFGASENVRIMERTSSEIGKIQMLQAEGKI